MNSRSKYENFVSLMCSSGIMLVICGIPAMPLVALLEYFTGRMPWTGAFLFAAYMTPLVAITGGILWWLGLYLAKRLPRTKADPN